MRTVGLVFKKEKSVKNEKTDEKEKSVKNRKADEKEKSVKNRKADEKSGLGDENAKVQE